MLCIWWNFEGILHFEFVPNGHFIDAELYCQQLERVYVKLKEKYPAMISEKCALLQQDNTKPHTAKKTKEKKSLDSWMMLKSCHTLPLVQISPLRIMVCSAQCNTSYVITSLKALMKLRKHAENSFIQSRQSGISTRYGS